MKKVISKKHIILSSLIILSLCVGSALIYSKINLSEKILKSRLSDNLKYAEIDSAIKLIKDDENAKNHFRLALDNSNYRKTLIESLNTELIDLEIVRDRFLLFIPNYKFKIKRLELREDKSEYIKSISIDTNEFTAGLHDFTINYKEHLSDAKTEVSKQNSILLSESTLKDLIFSNFFELTNIKTNIRNATLHIDNETRVINEEAELFLPKTSEIYISKNLKDKEYISQKQNVSNNKTLIFNDEIFDVSGKDPNLNVIKDSKIIGKVKDYNKYDGYVEPIEQHNFEVVSDEDLKKEELSKKLNSSDPILTLKNDIVSQIYNIFDRLYRDIEKRNDNTFKYLKAEKKFIESANKLHSKHKSDELSYRIPVSLNYDLDKIEVKNDSNNWSIVIPITYDTYKWTNDKRNQEKLNFSINASYNEDSKIWTFLDIEETTQEVDDKSIDY